MNAQPGDRRLRRRFVLACAPLALLLGCGASGGTARAPIQALALRDTAGEHGVAPMIAAHRLTVFVFYSEACPCLRVHEPRLEQIRVDYAPRGVALVLVDSELAAEPGKAAREARRRSYAFPLMVDPEARLARALGAEFATQAIVVDREGRVRYSGGIDSDKNHLRPSATPYLREALDDLLKGRPPRRAEPEALGCSLQLR